MVLLQLATRIGPDKRRFRRPAEMLNEDFPELLRAPVRDQELQARVVTALTIAVIAEGVEKRQ